MTYDVRYKPPKYQDNAAYAAFEDTGDPYQNLANGIVLQACEDYRYALRYKRTHDKAPDIKDYMTPEDIETLQIPARQTPDEKLYIARCKPAYRDQARWEMAYALHDRLNKLKRTRYKNGYRRYANHERAWCDVDGVIADCEWFFQSEWFHWLTKLDGPELMLMLRREVERE